MAFKGTQTTGTRTIRSRRRFWTSWISCSRPSARRKRKGGQANPETLKKLQEQFDQAGAEAQKYIVHDEYEEALTQQGATDSMLTPARTRRSISSACLRTSWRSG